MSSLNVCIIQSSLHWENHQANLNMFEEKIEQIKAGTELVVLPEMFTTGFSMNPTQLAEDMNGQTVEWMKRIATEKRIILTGSIIIKENDQFYNRLIWMLPNGEFGMYDKHHLFSYAEEDKHFSAGNKRLITSVKGIKINTQICYDLRFPVWSRLAAENEYDVLLYVANWPERRNHAWTTLLQARAIENQCYVIACNCVGKDGNEINYSGNSCIINPLGEILVSKEYEEDFLYYSIQKSDIEIVRSQFPFAKDKDNFTIL
jgi:predicted amidohydrolase